MKALLRSKGLWRLVDGKEKRPTTGDKEQESWDIKQDKAAGKLMLNLMPDQRVHIRASQDDPTAAWKALATLFVQQKASTRFVAYEEFFSIRTKLDNVGTSGASCVLATATIGIRVDSKQLGCGWC